MSSRQLPDRPSDRPPWPPWTSVAALVSGLLASLIAGGVVSLVAAAAGASTKDPPAWVNIVATVLLDVSLVGAAIAFAAMAARPTPAQFGLRPTRVLRAVALVVAGYVAFIVISDVWVALLDIRSKQHVIEDLGGDSGTAALLGAAFVTTVIAPMAEETIFRGYIFTALRGWLGVAGAAVVTGLLFGAIHVTSSPIGYLLPLAAFGVILCLVYWRTGSLYPCIALHALNNAIAFGTSEGWGWQIPVLVVGAWGLIALVLVPVSRIGGGRRPSTA